MWGNPNEASTKKHEETMYKQLWNFIMMYGDYDSLLIPLSPPHNNAISMTGKSIEIFLLYKHQKAGKPLPDPSTLEPVKDIFGKPFVCNGTWRAPDSNKIFNVAIANLPITQKEYIMRLAKISLQFMKMTSTRSVFVILAVP